MPDVVHDFPIFASAARVFAGIATPTGLDAWWSLTSSGEPRAGTSYVLGFGPEHQWRARVARCESDRCFELELTHADADWTGTRVGFELDERDGRTDVRFHHTGWPEANAHYRTSSFCWAMYLRLLKRYVESGEVVEYAKRLDA
jgi:uncharacterized protein YndB with AHSA1/START domain